jgi:hypothetical protein
MRVFTCGEPVVRERGEIRAGFQGSFEMEAVDRTEPCWR